MTKERLLPLSKGYSAIVDGFSFGRLTELSWHASVDVKKSCVNVYGRHSFTIGNGTSRRVKHISLHRFLVNARVGDIVDHINGDTLDNRLCNLRVVTDQQNTMNRRVYVGKVSRYKGVTYVPRRTSYKKWQARITYNSKLIHLKYWATEEEAALAYNQAAIKYFGEYANLNLLEAR